MKDNLDIFLEIWELVENKYALFSEVVSYFMVPSLLFSLGIGKMCYMEDTTSVYNYLKSLSFAKRKIVESKFLESFLTIILSYILFAIVNIIIGLFVDYRYNLTSNFMFYMFSIVLIYNSIYIFLNYKYNYASAQQTTFIFMIIFIGLFYIGHYVQQGSSVYNMLNNSYSGILLFIVSILISCVLCKFATKGFLLKNN